MNQRDNNISITRYMFHVLYNNLYSPVILQNWHQKKEVYLYQQDGMIKVQMKTNLSG